jgi:hypothetical protein
LLPDEVEASFGWGIGRSGPPTDTQDNQSIEVGEGLWSQAIVLTESVDLCPRGALSADVRIHLAKQGRRAR